jgi:hypothetical protein
VSLPSAAPLGTNRRAASGYFDPRGQHVQNPNSECPTKWSLKMSKLRRESETPRTGGSETCPTYFEMKNC